MDKLNTNLVSHAKSLKGCLYAWGMFFDGLITESAIQYKKTQYPNIYTSAYVSRLRAAIGKLRAGDCSGVPKSFLMADESGKINYQAIFDYSAERLGINSKPINTMPDIPGLLVFFPGHVGVYIGDCQVLEARGADYGVVITKLSHRPWKTWGYCPHVSYQTTQKEPMQIDVAMYEVLSELSGYYTAADALASNNVVTKIAPGKYYVFNGQGNALNLSSTPGIPGAWIDKTKNNGEVSMPSPEQKLIVDGVMGFRTVTWWQTVMSTQADGIINSRNSALIGAVQRFLNQAVPGDLLQKYAGGLLTIDGDLGGKTTKVLQCYLFNNYKDIFAKIKGRELQDSDVDGIFGVTSVTVLQTVLNRATAGSGKF